MDKIANGKYKPIKCIFITSDVDCHTRRKTRKILTKSGINLLCLCTF